MKKIYLKTLLTFVLSLLFGVQGWAADVTVDAKDGDITQYNGQTVNITIKNRTYQANNWVVVCYPFNVTKDMLDEAFPQGYAVEEYSSMSADGKFTFTVLDLSTNNIPAGTPFLLKSKVEVSSVTFNNVTINTTLHNITKTNGSYSGTLNGTYSKPYLYLFNTTSGNALAGNLFISASQTLVGPYNNPLNNSDQIVLISNGYFSFSEGVSTELDIEAVTIGGGNSDGGGTSVNTGLTDLGEGSFYGQGEYTYSYKGTSTNMVVGTTISYTTTTGSVDSYLKEKGVGNKWKTATSYKLVEDDITALEATNYTFWIAAWGAPITEVTITLPDGTVVDDEDDSDEDDNTPDLGFADLGKGGLFQQQDLAYSYTGNASTMVAGAVVTITSNSGNLVWYKNKSDYTGYNRGVKSYALTNDDITSLASNNYTLYFATWDGEEISNITLTNGGGGSTGMTLAQKIEAKVQLTDVPTLYITVPDAEGKLINKVLDEKKEYHTATIQLVDDSGELTEFTDQVMIKVRGNSTAKEDKKPYRLKFAKEIKDAEGNVVATCQKHDMLGRGPGHEKRNWTLLANYIDPAMIRNALTYHIGEAFNMPFKPGYKFADVVINGEYRGTYQISDHVEVGSDRIEVNEDTGWYLEASRGDMIEAPSYDIFSIKNPEPANEAEETELKNKIDMWFGLLKPMFGFNNGPFNLAKFSDPLTGWRKFFDEESLVDLYTAINLTGDYDGFMTVKMYRNTNERMKFGPLWDKDLAFGNWKNTDGKLVEEMQSGNYFNEYIIRITQDPVFIKKVHDRLHAILDAGYVDNMQSKISELKSLVQKTQELNHTKWSTSYQSWNLTFTSFDDAVSQLYTYVAERASWFAGKIDKMYSDLGGANIVDNTIGIDYNAETGPTLETEYTVPDMGFVNNQYKDYPIPASAFNNKATSALITVTGPSTIIFKKKTNQYGATATLKTVNSSNGETITATYLVEGNDLEYALSGYLLINCNGNASITVKVTNHGVPTPNPAERAQLTNLPTIYLDATTVDDAWKGVALEVFDKDNKLGQGATWTKTTADVSAQYQGSGDKNKDSYRLKFEAKTQLLSSGKFKQWVLLANDDDPTMMRNALAKEMGDALGLPFTPGYQFVDLYVNDAYMGTYQITDRIKVESGRALVTGGNKDDDWHIRFNDAGEYNEDKPTYYIEGTTTAPYIIPKNPDPKDNPTTWNSTLKSAMTTYFNSVFTTDASGKYTAFAENVDHQQLIEWYIAQEMLCVYKGFSSIEAYRSVTVTDQNLHIGVLWDSEKAFGNTGEAPAIDMSDLEAKTYNGLMTNYAAYDVMKNIFTQLWQERWFANGVNNLWKEKHEAMLSAMTTKAAALKTELEDSWAQNATKWSITGEQATSIDAMTAWLTQRDAYLTKKFAALAAALPCENHTYENNNYIKQDNGTYLVGCDVCGTIKEDSETFYKFTVYPESATKTEVIATSWQPSAEHPNSYATVTITPSGAEASISGYNIVNTTKNAGGDKTCADFRLTDGHPYYGDDGFVATKATYTRNISNEWGTLCLPFKTQKATTEYADFYHLGSVKNDNKNNASTLVFTPVQPEIDGNASAFIPVVFRATAKAKQEGKIVIEATNVSVKKTTGKSFITTNSTVADWTLIGTVEKKYFADVKSELASNEQLYYIAQNKFWQATTTYTNNPFRAYFIYAPSTPSAAKVSMFSISTDDNLATGITSANATRPLAIFTNTGSVSIVVPRDMKVSIYSANGMLVETIDALKDTEYSVNLAAGIYMVNGLKFVVK